MSGDGFVLFVFTVFMTATLVQPAGPLQPTSAILNPLVGR